MLNNKKIVIGGVTALVLIGLVWVVVKNNSNQGSDNVEITTDSVVDVAQPGADVLSLELTDIDGRKVKLADFAGKAMVINAWATWCPFCVEELQAFAEVKGEFGDAIEVIAVDRAESTKTAQAFIDKSEIGSDLVWLLDPGDLLYKTIGGFSMPETLFIKANGTIIFHKRGPMTTQEIRARVEDLLNN